MGERVQLSMDYLRTMFSRFWNPQLEYDMNALSGQTQQTYREFFLLWRLIMCVILMNIVACLVNMIYNGAVAGFIFSFLWVFLIPLYYYTWYSSLNKALQTNSSLSFIWFFLTFGLHTLIAILWAAGGFPASVGWYDAIRSFNQSWFCALTLILVSLVVTVYALASVYLIMTVHHLYRASGGSLDSARNEAATTAAANSPGFTVTVQPAPRY